MPSPKLVPLVLTDDERGTLNAWVRRRKTGQALAARSQIVLACADGGSIASVAAEVGVSRDMVSKWRARFVRSRLEGLSDEPRPGRPRTVTDEQVELVITKTLEEQGPGLDTHWSTRSMAAATGMSQSAVSRIWRAFGLKPHLVQTWKLSADPQFIEKVRDVVGLYLDPPEHALVLCVDEKSQIQALDRTAPCLPILPTTPARQTHDYVRHGTTSLFAALEVASGSVIAQPYRQHRHQEFLRFLKLIDAAVPHCPTAGHRNEVSQDIGISRAGVSQGHRGSGAGTVSGCRRHALSSPPWFRRAGRRARWPGRTGSRRAGSASWWPGTGPRERPRSSPGPGGPRDRRARSATTRST